MKMKYVAIAEMQEANKQFTEQLDDIQRWLNKLSHRVYACRNAIDNDIIGLQHASEVIDDFRSNLYEIDKAMEVVSANCNALAQTQTKEDNDEAGNRNQHESTSPVSNGQGSES
jgi:archaellum component FlaC